MDDKQISKKSTIYEKLHRKIMYEYYIQGKYESNTLNDFEALKSDWEAVSDDIKKIIGLKENK